MSGWAQKIREGDARALARAATGIENREPAALQVLHALASYAGHSRVIGITGPPGAGKSTLVDAMARALRQRRYTVAVIAIDPTSRITGGAILGDRIRMQQHHADPGIFIRSMATRGTTGGIARATSDLVRLMDRAGRDYILIETVGVGQDELDIAGLAHVVVVVLVPGMGDDVQAIKAGILEIADVFAINKSDQPGAQRVERELQAEGWKAPILQTVASAGKGIDELLDAIGQIRHDRPAPVLLEQQDVGIAVADLEGARSLFESLGIPATPNGPGVQHIALRIPDLPAAIEHLRGSGARFIHEAPLGAGRHLYVFVHPASAGGVLLELIQEARI